MKHDITVLLATGEVVGKDSVEFNFDADNGVLYLYSEAGIAYLNFKYVVQFGAVPAEDEL